MEFTLKELNQIYLFLLNRPEDSAVKLMKKMSPNISFVGCVRSWCCLKNLKLMNKRI